MPGLEEHFDELNKNYAAIWVGGKCCILKEGVDPHTGWEDITLLSPNDFHNYLANITVTVMAGPTPKIIQVSKGWMGWEGRRQYDRLIFDPSGKHAGAQHYNMFRGLPVKPVRGSCIKLLRHIRKVICGGNKVYYRYLLCWLARCVQDPGGERPGVAIVLKGSQGTGKGMLLRAFGALFGPYFRHIMSSAQLTGRFNSHLKNCLVCFSDEGVWGGDKIAEGILKGMITEPTMQCEFKGKDNITVENHINLLIASNNDWVIPASEEERRYFVLQVSDCRMQDKPYFKALADEIENGGKEAFMHFLLNNVNISKVDLRTPPRTDALLDQILRTMNSVKKFWYQLLVDGEFPVVYVDEYDKMLVRPKGVGEWPVWYPTEDLHFAYLEYAKANRDRYPEDRGMFTKALIKLCPGLKATRKSFQKSIRESCLKVPNLQECRNSFAASVKMTLEWPDLGLGSDVEGKQTFTETDPLTNWEKMEPTNLKFMI